MPTETLNDGAQPVVASPATEEKTDRMVAYPVRKLQEDRQEIARLREELRAKESTLPTHSATETLDPAARGAVDLLATESARVTREMLGNDLDDIRTIREQNEQDRFDRKVEQLAQSEYAEYIKDDISTELLRLAKEHPKTAQDKLLDMAEDAALLKAVKSGRLRPESVVSSEVKQSLTDRGRLATPRGGATGDRSEGTSVTEMTAEQLAKDPAALAARFKERYGRDRR
jgi:hypothetical protein